MDNPITDNIKDPSDSDVRQPKKKHKISFHGDGKTLFSIYIVNILLTIITLGLYHPCARAALIKFKYGETEFKGSRFSFHGTGKEMFIGMIKSIVILMAIYGLFLFATLVLEMHLIGSLIFMGAFIFIIPLAVVGSIRYRASRSSWRGIFFIYSGTYKSMLKIFIKGFLLSMVTFGIYSSWFIANIYKEVFSNLKFGNITFKYKGGGGDYFFINFKGYLLTVITLGIYGFKWQSEIHNYVIDNIKLYQGNRAKGSLNATTTGTGYLKLGIVNILLLVFTLGFAMPWVIVRTLKYVLENTEIKGNIDFENIEQDSIQSAGSLGEEMMDIMDMDSGLDLNII